MSLEPGRLGSPESESVSRLGWKTESRPQAWHDFSAVQPPVASAQFVATLQEYRETRAFFSWLLRHDYISSKPFMKVKNIKIPRIARAEGNKFAFLVRTPYSLADLRARPHRLQCHTQLWRRPIILGFVIGHHPRRIA